MESVILIGLIFVGITSLVAKIIIFIKKTYEYRCHIIKKDLDKGKRKWYFVTIERGLIHAILPLKYSDSKEFGEFDVCYLMSIEDVKDLLNRKKDKISNSLFVEDILFQDEKTEISCEKYEPATKL